MSNCIYHRAMFLDFEYLHFLFKGLFHGIGGGNKLEFHDFIRYHIISIFHFPFDFNLLGHFWKWFLRAKFIAVMIFQILTSL